MLSTSRAVEPSKEQRAKSQGPKLDTQQVACELDDGIQGRKKPSAESCTWLFALSPFALRPTAGPSSPVFAGPSLPDCPGRLRLRWRHISLPQQCRHVPEKSDLTRYARRLIANPRKSRSSALQLLLPDRRDVD